ncbi:hypothetical protein BDV25DRAFT_170962 [Aspergillus avenaceus]|uniref:Uncharacterized protein n=1 Tax=Aspergillus avenaceus TaxID=36643 RepID=A0A5N6U842_ASPAV|nr:hypothetical protein BDV25DRAFT_170962 [Aspergillus avenaceus]
MGAVSEIHQDGIEDRTTKTPEERPRRCWDWMIVTGTCHYARNRSSFVTYRRVGRYITESILGLSKSYVAGVGTVELRVRPSKNKRTPSRTLILENVLHIPGSICNGFCWTEYHSKHGGYTFFKETYSGKDAQKYPLWHGEPYWDLQRLVLAGSPQGETYLCTGEPESLSLFVDKECLERIYGINRQK